MRCWHEKGKTPVALINHTRDKFHVTGILGRRSFQYWFHEKQNQHVLIEILRELLWKRGKVLLLLDNARWHKGKLVRKFIAEKKGRVKLVYFPPYSPELNPVEQCWKEVKKNISNKLFHDTNEMKQEVNDTMNKQIFINKFYQYLCL